MFLGRGNAFAADPSAGYTWGKGFTRCNRGSEGFKICSSLSAKVTGDGAALDVVVDSPSSPLLVEVDDEVVTCWSDDGGTSIIAKFQTTDVDSDNFAVVSLGPSTPCSTPPPCRKVMEKRGPSEIFKVL